MTRILGLCHGWSLYLDSTTTLPHGTPATAFGHRDGRFRNPAEFAMQPEAREVYRTLRKELSIMDREWKRPGAEVAFKVADAGTLALQFALERVERWDPELLEMGAEVMRA